MEPLLVFGAILVVVSAIVGVQWWNSPAQVARRALRSLTAVPIGGLRPGHRVKVTGRVVLRQPLTSPLREAACAYWTVLIEEKAGKHWRTQIDEFEGVAFWLEDDSGRVHVDPGGVKLALETSRAGSSGAFDDPGQSEARALERFGQAATSTFGFNRTLRYSEASIDEGEQVAVIGTVAVVEIDGEPALALVPGDEGLVVSDAGDVHG